MPKMIDLSEVEASFALMRERLTPRTEEPGGQGAINRALLAIIPVSAMLQATEMNRDTPCDETRDALVIVCANMIASEIGGLEMSDNEKMVQLVSFMNDLGNQAAYILTNNEENRKTTIQPIEAGRA